MVHGLDTIKRLNDEAVRKARARTPEKGLRLPKGIALSPAELGGYTNTPWTKAELRESGQPDVYLRAMKEARPGLSKEGKAKRRDCGNWERHDERGGLRR